MAGMRSDPEQHLADGFTRLQLAEHVQRERLHAHAIPDIIAPIAAAIVLAVVPLGLSLSGRVFAALAAGAVGPIDRLVIRRFVPPDWRHVAVVMLRVVVATGFVILLPNLWYPSSVLLGCLTVGVIPAQPTVRIVSLVGVVAVALSATGVALGVEGWYLSVAILIIITFSVERWFREWEFSLTEVNRRHDEMVDRARMFSWEIDAQNGRILSLAGNVRAVLGYDIEELLGRHFSMIVPLDETSGPDLAVAGGESGERHAVQKAKHRDGHVVTVREVRLASENHNVLRGVSVDITELADAGEALRYQAEHDQLTGLVNRQVLETVVTDALAGGERVVLVLGDLDRFKEVNDTLGHPTGDRLLCVLAARFEDGLADLDVIARLGGDEFAFVAVGDVDEARGVAIAQRIYDLALQPVAVDGVQLAVACSVGVAISPDHGATYEDLLKHADIATYQAKLSLGGVRVFESAPNELSVQRLQMVSEVPRAVTQDEFELHLQPKVDLETGALVGVEGLARWRHPRLGLLMPSEFLHVIEVAADYHRFTEVMLAQALEFTAKARNLTGEWCPVAVNIGSMSFLDRSLPDRLSSLLVAHGIPGHVLTLEVTESDLLDESGADLPVFDGVKSLGIRLSIDDFGTGYSSLTRLRALDVDEVKIDRGFVLGLGRDPEDEIIVQAVVQLAGLLGHGVVAEGVETVEQMQKLRGFGCATGQGYLFSRPQPLGAMLEDIRRGRIYTVAETASSTSAATGGDQR